MTAEKRATKAELLTRIVLVLIMLNLAGMFTGSIKYRYDNPSLVEYLDVDAHEPQTRSFGTAGGGMDSVSQETMRHISELMAQLKDNPASYELRMEVAEHFMDASQWPSAIPHLEKAAEINPQALPPHMYLGYCRYNLGDYAAAAQSYAQAAEISGDANAKVNLAFIYKNHLNHQTEAKALLDSVINSNADESIRTVAKELKAAPAP